MNLKKYKQKSRFLLINTPSYKEKKYLNSKKIYQKYIKRFHKNYIKLITKINKKSFFVEFIEFDGSVKKRFKNLNIKDLLIFLKKLKTPKTNNLINLSLYSDYNPKTTTPGLGFKNKDKAIYTINKIKNSNIKYQVNVIATMLGRAKNHPHKTKDMNKAIKEFEKWMKNYKKTT